MYFQIKQRDRCFYKGWVTNSKLDINEQDMILHAHNKVRSDVALGKRLCRNKLRLRAASKMYSLVSNTIINKVFILV